MDMIDGLDRAIEYFGGQAALAEKLGLTKMAITQWKERKVPLERAIEIEKLTNNKVTRHDLRPDIFDKPESTSDSPKQEAIV